MTPTYRNYPTKQAEIWLWRLPPDDCLLPEQILKRLPRVIRTLTAFAGCFFFDHHTYRIQPALVELVFRRNSSRDRLIAFETARWIKMLALFTCMQSKPALRALPDRIREARQQGAAFGAARNSAGSRHINRARTKCVFSFCDGRLLELFLRATTRILISALSVLAIRQKGLLQDASLSAFWHVRYKTFFLTFGNPEITRLN